MISTFLMTSTLGYCDVTCTLTAQNSLCHHPMLMRCLTSPLLIYLFVSSSVQLSHVSDPSNWVCIADKFKSGISYCLPLRLFRRSLLGLAFSSYLLARLLRRKTLAAISENTSLFYLFILAYNF